MNEDHEKALNISKRDKTEYFNKLVYSTFHYPKGAATFRRGEKYPEAKKSEDRSPGPGEHVIARYKDVCGSEIQPPLDI